MAPALAPITPAAPPGLICNLVTNGGFTYDTNLVFSWSVPNSQNGIAGYSYALDQTPLDTVLTTATNAAINDLTAGSHVFQVQAEDVNGNWGPPGGFAFWVLSPPASPALVCNYATNGVPTIITNLVFFWQPPVTDAGLNGYSYALDLTPGNVTNTVGTNVAINNVTLGVHQFYVEAQDTNGVWGPASDFTLIAVASPPAAPPGLVCNLATNGVPTYYTNFVFSWSVPNSQNGIAGYSYALNQTPGDTVLTTTTSAAITGVSPGTNLFGVQAQSQGAYGLWGPPAVFTLMVISPPGAPLGLVCNNATNGGNTISSNLVFSWQSPVTSAGINGYSYALDLTPGNVTNTVVASATINNVTPGSHLFQVQAQDTNGIWGPATNFQFTVWTPGTEPPGAPPGLVCNVTSSSGVPTYFTNGISFTWQVPSQ